MPVNVKTSFGNLSFGPETGFFYTFNESTNQLQQIEADGDVVDTFTLDGALIRNPIHQLHWDGTFFWTMEDLPSNLGIVLKRWRLTPFPTAAFPSVSPNLFQWKGQITLVNQPYIIYDSEAFAVESYPRTFAQTVAAGSSTLRLDSVEKLEIGDILYLGPSSTAGFVDQEEEVIVTSINTTLKEVSFSKLGGLENSYTIGDSADYTKGVWVFNLHGPGGLRDRKGYLVKYAWPNLEQANNDQGLRYGLAKAADFEDGILSWVRADQIMQLNIDNPTYDAQSSMESNLRESDKNSYIEVFDLLSDFDNSQYLKLQRKETTEDLGTGNLTTTTFPDGKYNFEAYPTGAFVNSTALTFDDRFTITTTSPLTTTMTVTAIVRDQFNLPALAKDVQFSASVNPLGNPGTPGTFSAPIVTTNASGIATTIYTPSSTQEEILVDIEAEVL